MNMTQGVLGAWGKAYGGETCEKCTKPIPQGHGLWRAGTRTQGGRTPYGIEVQVPAGIPLIDASATVCLNCARG